MESAEIKWIYIKHPSEKEPKENIWRRGEAFQNKMQEVTGTFCPSHSNQISYCQWSQQLEASWWCEGTLDACYHPAANRDAPPCSAKLLPKQRWDRSNPILVLGPMLMSFLHQILARQLRSIFHSVAWQTLTWHSRHEWADSVTVAYLLANSILSHNRCC